MTSGLSHQRAKHLTDLPIFRRLFSRRNIRATIIKVDSKPKPSIDDKLHMQLRKECGL
jgi:hypothetical protein